MVIIILVLLGVVAYIGYFVVSIVKYFISNATKSDSKVYDVKNTETQVQKPKQEVQKPKQEVQKPKQEDQKASFNSLEPISNIGKDSFVNNKKHPKCIVTGVIFNGSYKRYHYLSKEMFRVGDTVVVPAKGEHKLAYVASCKEYLEHEELPFAYENMKYVVSNPYIKHPKCIVVSVYFPGPYNKKYHYLSKEMVSSGDTVVVPVAGESKSAVVYECKEYKEWEPLPYTYNEMKNVISIIRKPQNSCTNQTSSYQYYSKPGAAHPYYDSQMEDEYWEGLCFDDFDDYDEPFYHDVPVNHSGIWDEENEYYDMWDSIDEDNLF